MNDRKFDKIMRRFEESNDLRLHPDMFILARIDGRTFSTLTRDKLKLKPYDKNLRDCMVEATKHVMDCGFPCLYGFTQSDEISLFFDPSKNIHKVFDGKVRKFLSLLAGEASAKFSMALGHNASFDCRIIQVPNFTLVLDYFS